MRKNGEAPVAWFKEYDDLWDLEMMLQQCQLLCSPNFDFAMHDVEAWFNQYETEGCHSGRRKTQYSTSCLAIHLCAPWESKGLRAVSYFASTLKESSPEKDR